MILIIIPITIITTYCSAARGGAGGLTPHDAETRVGPLPTQIRFMKEATRKHT